MFSAEIHTLAQRAAFIDLLARRSGGASHNDPIVLSNQSGRPRRASVRVRGGRVVGQVMAVSVASVAPHVAPVDFDLAALATAVAERLHDSDIGVTPDQAERYQRSLQLSRPRSRRDLYFTTRAIFLTDKAQLATFNRVFAEVFGAPAGADRHREDDAVHVLPGVDRNRGNESGRVVAFA